MATGAPLPNSSGPALPPQGPQPNDITGLVLAGGRGSRMGGADKGLQHFHGVPLALHALNRLRPQVGTLLLSANRNLEAYRSMGTPVLDDGARPFEGPLAGLLAGLQHCTTPWLAAVPCDAPAFPLDLVPRLAEAAHRAGTPAAVATAPDEVCRPLAQPVFCLLHTRVLPRLQNFLDQGGRAAGQWLQALQAVGVAFDRPQDVGAFFNANTAEDLRASQEVPFLRVK